MYYKQKKNICKKYYIISSFNSQGMQGKRYQRDKRLVRYKSHKEYFRIYEECNNPYFMIMNYRYNNVIRTIMRSYVLIEEIQRFVSLHFYGWGGWG